MTRAITAALIIGICFVASLVIVTRADGEQPAAAGGFVIRASSTGPHGDTCVDAQRAITYYRAKYRDHRAVMGLPGPVDRVWYRICRDVRRRAVEWRERAANQRSLLTEWNSTVGRVVRKLDAGLAGTPMSGLGAILEQQGRRYGISPFFMAAAAGTESSFGAASCGNNPKNVWGLAACDGRWYVPYFHSWEQAIGFYARFLTSRWQGHTTPYSFVGYAACDACWGRKTSTHMGRFGVGNSTRYSAP